MSELTLSESIRLGAMLSEQGFDGQMTPDGPRCALAAACDALGIAAYHDGVEFMVPLTALEERYPALHDQMVASPRYPPRVAHKRFRLGYVIAFHLNDDLRWSRERIADWVERLESERQPADASARTDDAVAGDSLVTSGSPVRV
jgi:hypothetical protein